MGVIAATSSIGGLLGNLTGITSGSANPITSAATIAARSTSSEISQLFLRGTVIIVGFIFLAVGLTLFGKK